MVVVVVDDVAVIFVHELRYLGGGVGDGGGFKVEEFSSNLRRWSNLRARTNPVDINLPRPWRFV